MNDDSVLVKFVAAGGYEWFNINLPHVLTGAYKKDVLTFCAPPPVNLIAIEQYDDDNFVKYFVKTNHGWDVKVFDNPCYGCGSPWCM